MMRLHLHLLSDSTGETLENIAKAALAQYDDVETVRHFWPMVRSRQHLDRIVPDLTTHPGLVLYTLVNPETRARLEEHCPTSWNFSPRDASGRPGALEQALEDAPVRPGETTPVAVQHIVRSFDPCMVCTVH